MELISNEQLCSEWLEKMKNNVKYNSYHKYEGIMNNYLRELLDNYPLSRLDEKKVDSYFRYLLKEKECSHNLVPTIKIVLKSLYVYGEDQYGFSHIDFNSIKVLKDGNRIQKQQVLTEDQEKTLFSYCMDNIAPTSLAVLLALYTGLRLGELCALRYGDITMEEHIISVRRNVQIVDDKGKFTDEMDITNWVSRREVAMPDFLFDYFEQYSNIYKNKDDSHVLTNSDKFIKPRVLQYNIQNVMNKCEIQCSLMQLRNTFFDRCLRSGMNVYTVLSMMGISKLSFELKQNMNVSAESKQKEVRKMKKP